MASAFEEAAARVADGADPHEEARALVGAMTEDERRWRAENRPSPRTHA